jgi:sugar phosphate isomerase/epimerase
MWRAHPENGSKEAWADLLGTLERLVPIAEESGVFLGIEPELANVIDSASKAKQLLDDLKSPAVGIILDGANLVPADRRGEMKEIFDRAVALLQEDLLMAHAKDIPEGPGGSQAAGRGLLDWEAYLSALQRGGFGGPIILHNLVPEEVESSHRFVEETWRRCSGEGG